MLKIFLDFKKKWIDNATIKYVTNLCRLKKEVDDITVIDIRNYFKLKKEKKAIKNRIIRDIRDLFEHEEEDY